jgi:hypothetical protein
MIPEGLDHYESDRTLVSKKRRRGDPQVANDAEKHPDIAEAVSQRIAANLRGNRRIPVWHVALSSILLIALFGSVMSGMAIVEYGSVYMNWCTSTWWFHLWYLVC